MTPPRLFVREPALEVVRSVMNPFGLESYSPYQDRDLRDARIMDSGDLELPFGNTEEVLREIEERAAEILAATENAPSFWAGSTWSRWVLSGQH